MKIVKGSWLIPIGRTYWGRIVFLNLDGQSPHIKIAGVTGAGKSVAMTSILYFLCRQQSPGKVNIQIIDLKGGATFAAFQRLPHVTEIAYDTQTALNVLTNAAGEMWQRLELIKRARVMFEPEPTFPKLVIVIDEGGELAPADAINEEKKLREQCMDVLSSLARVGRESGVRIIYGTQRPDKNTLPMTVRPQMENTLCFRVSEHYDSKIVLGHEGAEQLPKYPGRMLYKTPAGEIEVQGVYVASDVLSKWLQSYPLKDENMLTPSINTDVSSFVLEWLDFPG